MKSLEEALDQAATSLAEALGIKPKEIHKMNPAPIPVPVPAQRPAYEILIDEFMELDKQCQDLIADFTTGSVIYKSMPNVTEEQGITAAEFVKRLAQNFVSFQEYLKQLIEKRNAKLQEAANALRGTVIAAESVVRGPDGKSTFKSYGPFEVSSKTSRTFDPAILIAKLQEMGLYSRLTELTTINKDSGKAENAFRQEWVVMYEPVKNFLREMNLEEILNAAYEEEEGTPAVTGPKPLAWVGDTEKKKGGKKG